MSDTLQALSRTRRRILLWIKSSGGATTSEIARELGVTDEGARQHLVHLEARGWVVRHTRREPHSKSGRPTSVYTITPEGEAFFPKRYDQLAITLIDSVLANYGREALRSALASLADEQVSAWEGRLCDLTLDERIEALRGFYLDDDPFATVERQGHAVLVERNCPFQSVAMQRPDLCSVTVSTLTRLLGVRVERRQTFQSGDGRCAFHVLADQPVDAASLPFTFEGEDERH